MDTFIDDIRLDRKPLIGDEANVARVAGHSKAVGDDRERGLIVPVPAAEALTVVPAVRVAVSVKVSAASLRRSFVIGVRTSTLVCPAAIVAPAASAPPPRSCHWGGRVAMTRSQHWH